MIDKIIGGEHSWIRVNSVIDEHGQILNIYKCKVCRCRGKQISPNLKSRMNSILVDKEKCKNKNYG